MELLKKHSHKERMKIVKAVIPLLKRKFGNNLVALAATGSFARAEDDDYSDLELLAFLREMRSEKEFEAVAKVYDGMLIEIYWTTEKKYLKSMDINEEWFLAGSETLYPILNKAFIEKINEKLEKLKEAKDFGNKCLRYAAKHFKFEVQEATSKVLNAIKQENMENLPLLLFDMLLHMLKVLSFLNKTPYKTFSTFITQAKMFKLKPAHFDELADMVINGKFHNLNRIRQLVEFVFSEFEEIFRDLGFRLSDDNFDPNIPTRDFISAN